MHGDDILGFVLSVALILLCWTAGWLTTRKKLFGHLSGEVARKIVHIGVSNFAFIYLYIFKNWVWPFAGLLLFAAINFAVEIKHDRRRSWGTVQYPLVIALLILLVRFGIGTPMAVAASLLGMGYGDGLASIAGMTLGRRRIPGTDGKTYAGSIALLVVVFLVCFFFAGCPLLLSVLTALAAALAEAYTPFNLDNITVPVVIFVMTGLINA